MANWSRNVKRILVVGGGLIGIRHMQAVQAHAGCRMVGLVDPDMTIQTDVPRFVTMADVTDPVDGVIIATPTPLHAPHGLEAAGRGWHMLIEKPVAASLEGAKELEAVLRRKNIRSLVGHHRRYHAVVQQLKSSLAEGVIGDVVNVSVLWCMRKPDAYFEENWRSVSGSPIMINLVHDIDILWFVIGEISEITALRGQSRRGGARVESGAIALAFENGAVGSVTFSDITPSPWGFEAGTGENPNIGITHQDMMWITGTKGAISFPSMTLWKGTDWGRAAEHVALSPALNEKTPMEAQLDHFSNVIDGAKPLIDVADAIVTLSLAEILETKLASQTSNSNATKCP